MLQMFEMHVSLAEGCSPGQKFLGLIERYWLNVFKFDGMLATG